MKARIGLIELVLCVAGVIHTSKIFGQQDGYITSSAIKAMNQRLIPIWTWNGTAINLLSPNEMSAFSMSTVSPALQTHNK